MILHLQAKATLEIKLTTTLGSLYVLKFKRHFAGFATN